MWQKLCYWHQKTSNYGLTTSRLSTRKELRRLQLQDSEPKLVLKHSVVVTGFAYEEDNALDFWIACDVCDKWYCLCEGLSDPPEEKYVCTQCSDT